ncbi:nucleotidyltransferase family protein [Flavilitoribacter nigricans]|uniref:Nucleotidyltransferase n=1 Tax=Flavilitoribacter nigricans (strain ATCC 23147 / DSM 23189 / NBRC 102662 / NCIMB 1420 / SS-2) TaxID=1122177 RepID=A0A2D0N6U8_FLAN2|nr:sugar phosphate nucleotidyltransferase [Flavilitoribacter nigricans]PHN04224.1 nucleotidyltransferase [Flavilitoribacter nigricans DSM 23189 = NBRC 102662]
MKPSLLILAAGMGSRYGGLKQVDSVGPDGEAIIEYSIYDAIRAGFGKVVFVIRRDIEDAFREQIGGKFEGKIDIEYVFQDMDYPVPGVDKFPEREKPWGTAHAMLVAENAIKEPFAVINADDYYGVEAFATCAKFLKEECRPDHHCMVGYVISNTLSDHGTVNRGVAAMDDDHYLTEVNERLKIQRIEGEISYLGDDDQRYPLQDDDLVSMNFWGFHPAIFDVIRKQFAEFVHENKDKPRAEFFIPLFVDQQINSGEAKVKVLVSNDRWYGVTYREDKPIVQQAFGKLIEEERYPAPLWG